MGDQVLAEEVPQVGLEMEQQAAAAEYQEKVCQQQYLVKILFMADHLLKLLIHTTLEVPQPMEIQVLKGLPQPPLKAAQTEDLAFWVLGEVGAPLEQILMGLTEERGPLEEEIPPLMAMVEMQ